MPIVVNILCMTLPKLKILFSQLFHTEK